MYNIFLKFLGKLINFTVYYNYEMFCVQKH